MENIALETQYHILHFWNMLVQFNIGVCFIVLINFHFSESNFKGSFVQRLDPKHHFRMLFILDSIIFR